MCALIDEEEAHGQQISHIESSMSSAPERNTLATVHKAKYLVRRVRIGERLLREKLTTW